MQKYLVTFSDSKLKRSLNRFKLQAENMNFYDHINCFNEFDLNTEFYNKFKIKFISGSRGYGYWAWKPQIILQTLEQMKVGDILQDTDSGCHLNNLGIERLIEYFNITNNSETGILAFKAKPPELPLSLLHDGRKLFDQRDYMYTKGDLIDFFNYRDKSDIMNDFCIGATLIFIKKSNYSLKIVKEWLKVIYTDFSLIDNSPSNSSNFEGFIEHRHDQAIFSLLCKKYGVITLSSYEYYYPKKNTIYPDWKILKNFPIHAKRDKDFGFIQNSLILINRVINKLVKIFKNNVLNFFAEW